MQLRGWTCVFEGQLLPRVVLTKVSGFGIMLISVVNLPNSSQRKFYQYRYILMVGLPYPITFLVCNTFYVYNTKTFFCARVNVFRVWVFDLTGLI
jgi:hypothetical protein